MLCAGAVQSKNVRNSMLKNLLDACGAAIGFYCFGYAFAFGGSEFGGPTTFIGNTNFFLMNIDENFFLAPYVEGGMYWFFQFAFAATAATIVAGTLAERSQMLAYLCYSFVLTGFIYPVVVHSVWSPNGFLSITNKNRLFGSGAIDFSGCGVVHITGGITALVSTKILGPRKGRFYDSRGDPLPEPKKFQQHSAALQVLGTFILWFGWYGFNSGNTLFISPHSRSEVAARAAISTTLGAASGSASALFANLIWAERRTGEATYDLTCALNGALSGLVSVTAGCTVIQPWAAIIAGFVGGLNYLLWSHLLLRLRLDDAVDAIPVHLSNGLWGLILVGLFATPEYVEQLYGSLHAGWFYSWAQGSADARLLASQLVEALFIIGWVFVFMYPFFGCLNYLGWFRADPLEEIIGLDISYHGGSVLHDDEACMEYAQARRVQNQLNKSSWKLRIRRKQQSTAGDSNGSDILNTMMDMPRNDPTQDDEFENSA